ncbi:MAG: N-6 DNA methylase, partial [Bacteroidales bacterium]|nr:N-6 DNA methylase [Bacteroidales bacterium]
MLKTNKSEGMGSVTELKEKLWQVADILRGVIQSYDYYFILYFLLLQRDGLLVNLHKSISHDEKNTLKKEVTSYNGDNAEILKDIYLDLESTLDTIPNKVIYEIVLLLDSLDQKVLKDNFPDIFDDLLYRISKEHGKRSGEMILPKELSEFLIQLANLPKKAKVYNPFAGLASFGVFLDEAYGYIGQEINNTTWGLGALRLLAYEREGVSKFLLGDSIINWNPTSNEKFDLIISNPPFRMRLQQNIRGNFGIIRTGEQFLIEKGIEDLTTNGKLIVVVSLGFLFGLGAEQKTRRFIVENDLLEMVISFPGGLLMNTGIPIAAIVINKNKNKKGFVHFIDANSSIENLDHSEKKFNGHSLKSIINSQDELDDQRIISNEKIKDFDYNLIVHRYFQKHVEGVPLSELVSVIRGKRNLDNQQGKFIRIRDLRQDKVNFKLDINSIKQSEIPNLAKKISKSCLLLATRWKTLKPTYFDYSNNSIFITPDIVALKVDNSKVDVNYLINELHTDYVKEQIDAIRVGSIVSTIRTEDLLNVKIKIPPIQEQRAKVKGVFEAIADEKKRELSLFNKIHGLESEITEQNTYLRHKLAGPISNLEGSLSNIKWIISEMVQPKVPKIMSLKVSENHDITFGKYLEIIERDILKISDAVRRQLNIDEDISSKKLEPLEVISFMQEFMDEYNSNNKLNFTIEFNFDKEVFLGNDGEIIKTYIQGNPDLLSELFNNLIKNAITHAFYRDKGEHIDIFLSKNIEDNSKDEIRILFSNTGKGFPSNFAKSEFIRKGSKSGENAGDGYGGWYINEIIKKHKGNFEIKSGFYNV